jgi:hypothetical protein
MFVELTGCLEVGLEKRRFPGWPSALASLFIINMIDYGFVIVKRTLLPQLAVYHCTGTLMCNFSQNR